MFVPQFHRWLKLLTGECAHDFALQFFGYRVTELGGNVGCYILSCKIIQEKTENRKESITKQCVKFRRREKERDVMSHRWGGLSSCPALAPCPLGSGSWSPPGPSASQTYPQIHHPFWGWAELKYMNRAVYSQRCSKYESKTFGGKTTAQYLNYSTLK